MSKLVFFFVFSLQVKLGVLIILVVQERVFTHMWCSIYFKERWSWLKEKYWVFWALRHVRLNVLLSFFLFYVFFLSFWWYRSWVLLIQPLNTIKFSLFILPYKPKSSIFYCLSKPWNPTYFLLPNSHQITHQSNT